MTDDALLDVLQNLGLTEYQSRAYAASVGLGTARFSELAERADIPQQRIYDVVEDLEGLGLVEVHQGSGGKEAVPVAPETGLTELKERHIDEFASSVDEAIDSLEQRFEEVDASRGFVSVVHHESSVLRHVRTAFESADWRLFLSLPVDWYRDLADDVAAVLDRGVSVELIVQGDSQDAVTDIEYPDRLDVRYRPSADLVVAADREYGVFRGVAAPSMTRPSLVTTDENIVEMLQRYSRQFWVPSPRIQQSQTLPRRYLTPWDAIQDLRSGRVPGDDHVVRVEGHDTETGHGDTWEGRLVGHEMEPDVASDFEMTLPEVARLELDVGGETVTVGGWDARLEDVAAHGLELRSA